MSGHGFPNLRPKPLALTMGEPAGIGGEIALKAWLRRTEKLPVFCVIDDADRLQHLAAHLDIPVPVRRVESIEAVEGIFETALPVLHQPLSTKTQPGCLNPDTASAVIAAIETAVRLARSGDVAGVVTNPIHKLNLYDAGFQFPGHTEFLASLAGNDATPVMMLASTKLRVVPVSVHVDLRHAIASLDANTIVQVATITDNALGNDFGIGTPKLAVAGLNPHAGEGGKLGGEEVNIIKPAIDRLREQGVDAFGPMPPDTLFSHLSRSTYDAAICMYHDQALIPLKALDFDGGVNVTLGLPFVRTSPDHGTALDIAGCGRASEASLVSALLVAADIAARRAEHDKR